MSDRSLAVARETLLYLLESRKLDDQALREVFQDLAELEGWEPGGLAERVVALEGNLLALTERVDRLENPLNGPSRREEP